MNVLYAYFQRYSQALRTGLVAKSLKRMSESSDAEYAITSSLDDTREQQELEKVFELKVLTLV